MPTLTKLYTMEEASEHNTNEDCCIVIEGKVYDVSSYLDEHPGGDDVILGTTGKDATDEFEDAGHSKDARELMEKFCIGELEETEMAPPIRDLETLSTRQQVLELSKQYWFAPVTLAALSMAVGYLHLRKNRRSKPSS